MRFVYPYETEQEGKSVIVSFPDVPGALTQVDPGENLDAMAHDCLLAALGGYIELRQVPPRPSAGHGRPCVTLDILASAKLALATAMLESGMSNVALATALKVSEKIIRRLLDLDHVSRIDRLEHALACVGKQLEISVRSLPQVKTFVIQNSGY